MLTSARPATALLLTLAGMLLLGLVSGDGFGPGAALAQSDSLRLDKPTVPVRVQTPVVQ